MDTTPFTNLHPELTALDRCDSCGAQAYVRVFLEQGDLLFCGHHFTENQEQLSIAAVRIQNETHKILPPKDIPEEDVE